MIEEIKKQMNVALKARDEVRLSTLKMLYSELHNLEIDKKELTSEDEIGAVKREIKKRKDAIEAYDKAGATEKSDREKAELKILEEFMPEQMGDEELVNIVNDVIKETGASGMSDVGRVIGAVMGKAKGQADGSKVSALVKEKLQ